MTPKTKTLNAIRTLFKNRVSENILRGFIKKGVFSKLAPNHYQYKTNSFRKIIVDGIYMNIDISDYVGHYLYFGFEDTSANSLFHLVKPDMTILDIGANIGFTALSMAKRSGPKSKIFAFEPDPYNFTQLKQNTALNQSLTVNIYNIGLGSKKDQLKLAINTANNRGGNRIKSDVTENYNLVEIIKVDDFVSENNVADIDLVKIDVEGFELNVLKGAENSIIKYSPVLFIELSDNNLKEQGSNAKDLVSYLNELGYKCINSDSGEKIYSNTDFSNCHYDIICTRSNA